jgi:hypothetical protein
VSNIFTFTAHCIYCGVERRFNLACTEIQPNGEMVMSGTCHVCNNEQTKDMGKAIYVLAKCQKCMAEIAITTFEGDPTKPLTGHSKCGYTEQLEIIKTV